MNDDDRSNDLHRMSVAEEVARARQREFEPPERAELRDVRDWWNVRRGVRKAMMNGLISAAAVGTFMSLFREQVSVVLSFLLRLFGGDLGGGEQP